MAMPIPMNYPVERQTIAPSIPTEHEMMVFHTMAEQAVTSKMYRGVGEKAGVMMIMLSARELGISPMAALNGGLNIINGKVEMSAKIMGALIRKAGHQFEPVESNENLCILKGKRGDTGEMQMAKFTIEEAKVAGLIKPNGGWVKWPEDMCYARALSRLARRLFSDVIGMGYVEGEISGQKAFNEAPKAEEETTPTVQVDVEPIDYEKKLNDLYDLFDKEDRYLLMEYMKVVMKHFSWTQYQCIEKFHSEPNLIDKFNAWKAKHPKE
jgi:hypothetical protein